MLWAKRLKWLDDWEAIYDETLSCEVKAWWWLYTSVHKVSIWSDNVWSLFRAKPSHQPVLICCQFDSLEQTLMTFESITMRNFLFKKMSLKIPSAKSQLFCAFLNYRIFFARMFLHSHVLKCNGFVMDFLYYSVAVGNLKYVTSIHAASFPYSSHLSQFHDHNHRHARNSPNKWQWRNHYRLSLGQQMVTSGAHIAGISQEPREL